MTVARRARMAVGALALATLSAQALDDARVQVEQRIRLTAALLADSRAAQRISSSGNPQAVGHLDEGRVHHTLALERLARGDVDGAREAVDHALHHMGLARRLVPDDADRRAAARSRYTELMASTDRLIEAWRARAAESATAGDATDMTAALGLLGRSRDLAESGRHIEALALLQAAQFHVLAAVNQLLDAATLDYTERPATPAEAYRIEQARLQGMADLVPLALQQLQPAPDARLLIERYQDTSRRLRIQAQQRHEAGDTGQALDHLRNASQYLQRALAAAGVVTPEPAGGTP